MAGVELSFDMADLGLVQARVEHLADVDRDTLLDGLGAELETQVRRRIADEKTTPDGEAWQPLTDEWAARKAKTSSGGILEFEGHLHDSIASQREGDAVAVGSELVYAAIQHFGGEDVGRPGHPSREYLGLSPDNIEDLEGIVADFLEAA